MRGMRGVGIVMVAAALVAAPAAALDLEAAKGRGLVGERDDGYVAAVGTPSKEVAALVDDVNAKRREAYEKVAHRNGTSLAAVARIAGKKLIDGAPPGAYVNVGGAWVRKQASKQ